VSLSFELTKTGDASRVLAHKKRGSSEGAELKGEYTDEGYLAEGGYTGVRYTEAILYDASDDLSAKKGRFISGREGKGRNSQEGEPWTKRPRKLGSSRTNHIKRGERRREIICDVAQWRECGETNGDLSGGKGASCREKEGGTSRREEELHLELRKKRERMPIVRKN